MSQIATFFSPVISPNVAGTTALAATAAAPGESFATTLLNLNAMLGVADPNLMAAAAGNSIAAQSAVLSNLAPGLRGTFPVAFAGDAPPATVAVAPNAGIDSFVAAQFALLPGAPLAEQSLPAPAMLQAGSNTGVDASAAVQLALLFGAPLAEQPQSAPAAVDADPSLGVEASVAAQLALLLGAPLAEQPPSAPSTADAGLNANADTSFAAQFALLAGVPLTEQPPSASATVETKPNTTIDASFAAQFASLQAAPPADQPLSAPVTVETRPNLGVDASTEAQVTLPPGAPPADQPPSTTVTAEAGPNAHTDASAAAQSTPPAPATLANIQPELRGSLAAPTETAQPRQQTPVAQPAPAAIAAVANAFNAAREPQTTPNAAANKTNAKSVEPAKRATNKEAVDAAAHLQPQTGAPNAKPTEGIASSAAGALSDQPQNSNADGAKPTANAATQQPTPAIAATVVPVLPSVVDAQQTGTALVATPQSAVPLGALAVHIARKFDQGVSQFEIRLHPADLGQLDISLTIADDGRVQASLRAERPETLELLQRDARALEQQLRQAGLDVGSNALSFSLSNGNSQRQAPFKGWPAFAGANDTAGIAPEVVASKYVAVRTRDGIDIRI